MPGHRQMTTDNGPTTTDSGRLTQMKHELFRIPIPDWVPLVGTEIPIFGYELMLVLGFYAGLQLMRVLARRRGLDPDIFVNGAVIALSFGIGGARLSHVLENLRQ